MAIRYLAGARLPAKCPEHIGLKKILQRLLLFAAQIVVMFIESVHALIPLLAGVHDTDSLKLRSSSADNYDCALATIRSQVPSGVSNIPTWVLA